MEVCRGCMNSSLSLVDMFKEQPLPNDQSSLADMVNKLVECQVDRDDQYPKKMCESCCLNAQIAYKFKDKFEQCDQLLSLQTKQIKLEPLEIKIEVEPEESTTSENPSPTTTNAKRSESQSRQTSDVDVVELNSCSSIDGSAHNVKREETGQNSSTLDFGLEILKKLKLKSTKERPFKCEECPAEYGLQSNLNQHIKLKHTEKHTCKLCSAHLANQRSFQIHMRIHTPPETPFKCTHCTKAFVRRSSLNIHNRIHTGERPFKCADCPLSFSKHFNLQIHKFQHTGERPFGCSRCPKSFIQKCTLDMHMKSHTGERPFRCSYCNKGFVKNTYLTKHIRIHTGEHPYKCEECLAKYTEKLDKPKYKMAFKDKRQLIKHMHIIHKAELDKNYPRLQKSLKTA